MNYKFPVIKTIHDVLPAIKGCDDFIVAKKDGYTVINYVVTSNETFPPITEYDNINNHYAAIRRECRGLMFDPDGNILSRRFHKFFNLGEHPEVAVDKIDLSQPHHILEKLDGSMITPVLINGEIRWCTKMGTTDVAAQVEEFVKGNKRYKKFAWDYQRDVRGIPVTLIFEWTSRKQRIVLDYPEDNLTLLAIRYNETGEYFDRQRMADIARIYNIPVVNINYYYLAEPSIQQTAVSKMPFNLVLNAIKEKEGDEGVVVTFENGHRVKIKSDWYVRLHKTKEKIASERDVCALILNNQLDDLLPVLSNTDKDRVIKYRDGLLFRCRLTAIGLSGQHSYFKTEGLTRKDFALNEASKWDPILKSLMFSMWDEKEVTVASCLERLYNAIIQNTGSTRGFEKVKANILKGLVY